MTIQVGGQFRLSGILVPPSYEKPPRLRPRCLPFRRLTSMVVVTFATCNSVSTVNGSLGTTTERKGIRTNNSSEPLTSTPIYKITISDFYRVKKVDFPLFTLFYNGSST